MKYFLGILTATLLHATMTGMETTTTIVLEDSCSLSAITLFEQATSKQESEFPSFWKKLSVEQQTELTNSTSKTKLNAPGLAALIADNYLPQEAIQNHIMPCMNMHKVIRYIRKSMIQENLSSNEEKGSRFGTPRELIFHENGAYHYVPTTFQKNRICTGDTSNVRPMALRNKEKTGGNTYGVLCSKIVNNYDYRVSYQNTSRNLCLWRIKNAAEKKEDTWWYNEEDSNITQKTYPFRGNNARAVFSPNGAYIALVKDAIDHPFCLLSIDETSKDIVISEIILPQSLFWINVKPQFSPSSTMVAFLSFRKNQPISQLIVHHIPENLTTTKILPGIATGLQFNTKENKLYIALCSEQDQYILVCKADHIDLPISSKIKTSDAIAYLEYDKHKHCLAAQLCNGNMVFVSELNDTTDSVTEVEVSGDQEYSANSGCLAFLPKHSMLISYALNIPYVTLWDTITKTIIGKRNISPHSDKKCPCSIVITKDEASFLTNNGLAAWNKQTLYAPTLAQKATLKWIKNCPTLFKAYMLQTLYKAHKNNDATSAAFGEHIQHFIATLPTEPHNIQKCIQEFLIVQKRAQ